MAQVRERFKTFWLEMLGSNDRKDINEENIEKLVQVVRKAETRDIKKMEQEVGKVNIPLGEKVTTKVKVDEKSALEEANKKAQTKQKGDMQREE